MSVDLYHLMQEALQEAHKGLSKGEVPVGAVLADQEGNIAARAHNQPISLSDPTAHAEILAIRKAGQVYGNYRLNDSLLVVTMEPCLMCMGAAVHARIKQLVFGTPDLKSGAAGSVYDICADGTLNHHIQVIPGVREEECRILMQEFFQSRRAVKT